MKGFSIRPNDLHGSAKSLGNLGDQLSSGGQKLSTVGSSLTSAASGDRSGIGSAIVKSFGRGVDVTGKVFTEGGRVAGASGRRLASNADNHVANDAAHASRFRNIQDPGANAHARPGSGAGAGGSRGLGATGSPAGGQRISRRNTSPHANSTPIADRPACGDPVDIATGRMMLTQTDVELAGALALVVSRTHLSNYGLGRSFGASWASTLDQRVEVEADAVHFAAEDGSLLVYPVPGATGTVLPLAGPRRPLARENGGFAIADPDANRALVFAPSAGREFPLASIVGPAHRIDVLRDAAGTPVELRHSAGHRLAIDSADGLVTALRLLAPNDGWPELELVGYRYDDRRRLVEVVNSTGEPVRFEYDDADRIVRWVDRNGMWNRYTFDAEGRCVRTEGADGYLAYTFDYDRENRVTRATDSLGGTTVFELDDAMRVVRETDPLGHSTLSEWDPFGRPLATTDPLGNTTRHEYDAAGDLVATTWPDGSRELTEYDARHRPVAGVDPDGAVWRREYADDGRVLAVVDATGARTTYAYDEAGNLAGITDHLGNTTRIESNELGLPAVVADALGNATTYEYDMFGRTVAIIDPLGGVTSMTWTPEGQPRSWTEPDGTTEHWLYDGEGNGTVALDAEGGLTRTETAHFDLPVARIGPDGARLEYAYDTELRVVAVTNEQGRVWRHEYDAAGNLVREKDFTGREVRFRYDAAGRLVERVNGAGQSVRMERDALGRTVRRISGDAVTTFEYDPAGRIVRARNADAEAVLVYDAAGRVLSETVNGRTVASRYDPLGRRTGLRTPTGATSTWQFDAVDRPVVLHTAGQTFRFGHDSAGREVRRDFGAGVRLAQEWDANDQLREQTLFAVPGDGSPGRVTQRRAYAYREDGVLAAVADRISGPKRFDVDAAGRVTAVHSPGGSERYSYDPAGNLTSAGLPGQDTTDREFVDGLCVRVGGVDYEYDADGRVVSRQWQDPDGVRRGWHYTWDAEDKLVEARTPDGQRWRYRYDPLGRRIAKLRLGEGDAVVELVEFTWDGDTMVEQVHNGRSALVWDFEPGTFTAIGQTERVLGRNGAQWVDERFHAIVSDLVGAPRELVAPDGTVALHAETSLWGLPRLMAAVTSTPLRFPGQYQDDETGLYYNFHRHYDPLTAAYATSDPLGLAPSPNPRAYVGNPTGWSDPLGLMGCRGSGGGGGGRKRRNSSAGAPYSSSSSGRRQRRGTTSATSQTYSDAHRSRLSGPSQVGYSGSRVPQYDPTHGGLFPASAGNAVPYAGQHRYTQQYSTGNQYQSEHMIPSLASRRAGVPGYSERYEPTMSIPTTDHQPPSGAGGLGGGHVSSTGSGYVPNGWSQRVADQIQPSALTPSGRSYYGAAHMTGADEMNVNPHSASGVYSVVNQHHAMGRLTDAEHQSLQQSTLNRYYNEQQYGYSTGAPASPYHPGHSDFQWQPTAGSSSSAGPSYLTPGYGTSGYGSPSHGSGSGSPYGGGSPYGAGSSSYGGSSPYGGSSSRRRW